jgi:hypothetical protein
MLSRHLAHLFIRDPLVVFDGAVEVDDEKTTEHFESIQSTNVRSLGVGRGVVIMRRMIMMIVSMMPILNHKHDPECYRILMLLSAVADGALEAATAGKPHRVAHRVPVHGDPADGL